MKAISVLCNHCGAPLEIGEQVRFATCSHCGTHLKLQRKGGAAFTEVLDDIDARTRKIAEDVSSLKKYEALERIDREWKMEKEDYQIRVKDGEKASPGQAIMGGVVSIIAGVIFISLFLRSGAPKPMAAFPGLFIIMGIYYLSVGLNKRSGFAEAQVRYKKRRQKILDEIED